ncbi:hypothetical protein [Sulfitobacter guttiformis]|uniref:Cytochrome c domain-containing protein n=1 Tax=Sulfitobacter guttiformis TaxID=74349 RepID=A0A420DK35_9RHOB|nr:hypothetical protein [Sulfitobacter guttiformis]KIN71561.1 hypothetical protein Z949_722 [Sulfitobacter guttiformis KCTC 32187]RKE94604.1 hypothetical protein C8N30_3735 [Sulfitobacter guttiformis]
MRFLALLLAAALPAGAQAQEGGAAAWDRIFAVTSHPRCTNCHVGDSGRPVWDDLGYGKARPHGMNIVAGESRIGAESIPCRVCHISTDGKNAMPHAAPQIDDAWRLPPVELAWHGKTSVEVCTQLRNPDTNDGFDLVELVEHVRTSAFVNYGFVPGAGRTPAPGSVEDLAQDLEIWAAAGTPCESD